MEVKDLYQCHNRNSDGRICGHRGSNIDAIVCPMCGGKLRASDWFEKREGDEE